MNVATMSGASTQFPVPEFSKFEAPRELPESFYDGQLVRSRKSTLQITFAVCCCCLILSAFPFVRTLSLYVLPLKFLSWIGVAIGAIGTFRYMFGPKYRQAVNYLESGEFGLADVREMAMHPAAVVDGSATRMKFVANVELPHPDTGRLFGKNIESNDFAESEKKTIATRFRIGDRIPVVWMPQRFEETLQIYDFLEATPDASLVRSKQPTPIVEVILSLALITALFLCLFWNVLAFGLYSPLDVSFEDMKWPIAIGSILGIAMLLGGHVYTRRQRREKEKRNAEAIATGQAVELAPARSKASIAFSHGIIAFGAIILSIATVTGFAFTANALLDTSNATEVPVEITEMTQTTHSFVFREYEMEYKFPDKDARHTLMSTPQHLAEFDFDLGIAKIRQGRFGWKWVETVKPMPAARAKEE